MSLDEMATSI